MFWRDPRSDLATVRAAARRRTPKRSRVEKRCAATSTLSVFELKKNVVLPRIPMQSSRETAVVRRPGISFYEQGSSSQCHAAIRSLFPCLQEWANIYIDV